MVINELTFCPVNPGKQNQLNQGEHIINGGIGLNFNNNYVNLITNTHFMDDVEIMFKEYDAVKEEIADSIKARNQILSFGLATVAILINGISTTLNNTSLQKLSFILCFLVLPAFCVSVMLMWMGELQRMIRGGNFMTQFENRINEKKGQPELLRWETYRRTSKIKIHYAYGAVISLFSLIALLPYLFLFISTLQISWFYYFMTGFIYAIFLVLFLKKFPQIMSNDSTEV